MTSTNVPKFILFTVDVHTDFFGGLSRYQLASCILYLISINQLLLSFDLTMSCLLAKFFSMLLSATWFATGRWFSSGTHISSTNKTDRHDITVILLKITLNTINLNLNLLTLWFLSLLVASKISFKEIIWSSSVKYFVLFSIPFNLFHISDYQGGNQNPYIEEEQTT